MLFPGVVGFDRQNALKQRGVICLTKRPWGNGHPLTVIIIARFGHSPRNKRDI